MGYRVDYPSFSAIPQQKKGSFLRRAALTLGTAALFLTAVNSFSPEGAEILERLFQPDRWLLTRSALETMAARLKCGEPLTDAVTAFCRELVQYGMAYGA